ncbi:MAG: hypothetical protein Roseis2KO_09050 [Roseivirga sp.]
MMKKTNPKLPLTDQERSSLRKNKVKISQLPDYAVDELEVLLGATAERARELYALAEFQTIPSIGIKFAEDLVFLGYYSIAELKGQDGAKLTDAYELKKGFWIDSCVEDQFRLAVHYANTGDASRTWWSFTNERKAFRAKNGYPENRPETCWYDVFHPKKKEN